jgi:hypothetical protein
MGLIFVDKNPENINDGIWVARMEISLTETIVFGIDNSGNPEVYLYSHILRSMQTNNPAYRLIYLEEINPNNIQVELGKVANTNGKNPNSIISRYNIFETKAGIHIATRKNENVWETFMKTNALEANLLKAKIKSLIKKLKEEENEFIGY